MKIWQVFKRCIRLSLIFSFFYSTVNSQTYFPPTDQSGGWRTLSDPAEIKEKTGIDVSKLDDAFEYIKKSTKNGGLLVLKDGWLVFEEYFGKGHREATPNLASCGKSFTSIAIGIMMAQYPELFPEGLDQKIFNSTYLPDWAFPLPDPAMHEIRLGQLLSFTAGIRGNNPVYINGKPGTIDPVGPDGWYAIVDEFALGIEDGKMGNTPFSVKTLWCEPGKGYSYATASIHIASIMLRHITGMEMEEYINRYLASELGWGRWGFGYKYAERVKHTPGGGGIALRATDMLRFGYLLLNNGKWENDQVVPEWYVQHATNASLYNPHFPYSLQFDVNTNGKNPNIPLDAFWKTGSGYHCFYVVPSLNLVVWKLAGRDGQYSESDTGIPAHPEAMKAEDNREGWNGTVDGREAITKAIEMVVESIIH